MQEQNRKDDDVNKDPQEQKDQGRSSFGTGSTTQGGSNYGQGSSNLGGEANKQGSTANAGANYSNETDRLGNSTIGTNNEGAASPEQGADKNTTTAKNTKQQGVAWNNDEERNDARRGAMDDDTGKDTREGDRRDTSLEQASGMGKDQGKAGNRKDTGGWSKSSGLEENN